jgi:hypothetical protein
MAASKMHQINCNGLVITDIERDALHRETARSQGPYLHTQRLHDSMGRVRWQLCDAPARDFLGRRAEFALNLVQSDPQDAWKHLNSPVGPYQERGKSLFHLAKTYRYPCTPREDPRPWVCSAMPSVKRVAMKLPTV